MNRYGLHAIGALALSLALLPLVSPRAEQEPHAAVLYSDVTIQVEGELLHMAIAHIGPLPAELAESQSPYALNGLKRQAIPSPFWYNSAGAPPGISELSVTAGFTGWNAISSAFSYAYVGPTAADASVSLCARAAPDGKSVVLWTPISFENVLGVACWSGVDECDIIIDPEWPWGPGLDVQTVILHEAGHCAGLSHSAAGAGLSVMAPSYAGQARAPKPDDVAAICALYGCFGPSPTPGATPTPTPTPTLPARAVLPALARE